MDRAGRLPAQRTATGRRYWLKRVLDEHLGHPSLLLDAAPDLRNCRKALKDALK